ncbi:hypothetical protein QBC39DRAFT_364717 [Podospora conica]|nr:hypothetical protein QBC39DRAFT_364717 [Schizothecium conicum]
MCVGMNPTTFKLEWRRFGAAGDHCFNCVARKTDNNHSLLACQCSANGASLEHNNANLITSTLDLDAGLVYSQQQFFCNAPTRRSTLKPRKVQPRKVQPRKDAVDHEITANCVDIRMSQNLATTFALEANCHNPGDTKMFPVKLDLNACITVGTDSKLVWGGGHGEDLCAGCVAGKAPGTNKSYITCRCALNGDVNSASGVTSTLELDPGIKVDDGHLWCDPQFHHRDAIPEPALVPKDNVRFTEICGDITLAEGEELRAMCGSTASLSVLDLNKCIGFNHHTQKLEWASHGKIDASCKFCELDLSGAVFACQCDGLGLEHTVALGMDEGIIYKNGALFCPGRH